MIYKGHERVILKIQLLYKSELITLYSNCKLQNILIHYFATIILVIRFGNSKMDIK